MKKLIVLLCLFCTPAMAASHVPPPHRTNYVIIHDHDNHANAVAAGVFIGLGVALVIYAITSERHDPTRLTYRF